MLAFHTQFDKCGHRWRNANDDNDNVNSVNSNNNKILPLTQ